MVAVDDRFYTCPNCGWVISFRLVNDKYVSMCPYCKNRLEIDKEEYENEENDKIERYFEFE